MDIICYCEQGVYAFPTPCNLERNRNTFRPRIVLLCHEKERPPLMRYRVVRMVEDFGTG